MAKFLQPSLSGGELAPGLRGRVDLARYAVSLGKSRNFITKPTGGGVKRPGTIMRGRVKYSDRTTRLIPFVFSTDVKYVVEMGDQYVRFWADGALVTNSTKAITSMSSGWEPLVGVPGHGLQTGQYVLVKGVSGPDKVNDRTFQVTVVDPDTIRLDLFESTDLPAYVGGGTVSRVVEVATPYSATDVRKVRFTQSADVIFLTHPRVPPRELRRLSPTSWQMRTFDFRRGPFRPYNANEAHTMAVSGTMGIVTVSSNLDTFTDKMVGQLIYLEEKELRGIKPWASAEKNVGLGQLRRSDSKVYKAVGIPANKGSAGTPYYVTGGVRPVHDIGRAFDGPQDVKFDGVNDYAVGVEWEFVHNTFGVVKITEFIDAKSVKAQVIETMPDSIVGQAQTPAGDWDLVGDGVSIFYALTGASSTNNLDYRVTINGVPVQSNPDYPGGGGVGGGSGPGRGPGPINDSPYQPIP